MTIVQEQVEAGDSNNLLLPVISQESGLKTQSNFKRSKNLKKYQLTFPIHKGFWY